MWCYNHINCHQDDMIISPTVIYVNCCTDVMIWSYWYDYMMWSWQLNIFNCILILTYYLIDIFRFKTQFMIWSYHSIWYDHCKMACVHAKDNNCQPIALRRATAAGKNDFLPCCPMPEGESIKSVIPESNSNFSQMATFYSALRKFGAGNESGQMRKCFGSVQEASLRRRRLRLS